MEGKGIEDIGKREGRVGGSEDRKGLLDRVERLRVGRFLFIKIGIFEYIFCGR